jgi:hypothetical protein
MRSFTDKYFTYINNINYLYSVYEQLEDKNKIDQFVSQLKFTWIKDNVINDIYNQSHPVQVFIRVFLHISLMASIEIVKMYNPTIAEINTYNTNYDGSWLVPMDPMHMDQMTKLRGLFKLVQTTKYTPK